MRFLYIREGKVKTKDMDGFFEIVKCHCVGNFWVSPEGKIIPVIEHDSVAFSIIEERYEDEFDLIELDDFRYNVCNFLMVKGWIRVYTRGFFEGFMKYSRWHLTQSQRDALFDLTGRVFDGIWEFGAFSGLLFFYFVLGFFTDLYQFCLSLAFFI